LFSVTYFVKMLYFVAQFEAATVVYLLFVDNNS